jgi:tetratricopeptide (TPR) repeat protein
MKKLIAPVVFFCAALATAQNYKDARDLVENYKPHANDFFVQMTSAQSPAYYFSVEDQINGTDLGGLYREEGLIDRFLAWDEASQKVTTQFIPEAARERVAEADKLFFEKQFDKAWKIYAALIKEFPKYAKFQTMAGEALFAKADYKNAFGCYQKAIALNPYGYMEYWFAADCAMRLNDKKKALDYITYAYALNKDYSGFAGLLEEILVANNLYKRNNAFLPFSVSRESETSCRIRFYGTEGMNFLPMARVLAVWHMDAQFSAWRKMLKDAKMMPSPMFYEMVFNQKQAIDLKVKNKTPLSEQEKRFKQIADSTEDLKFYIGWELLFKGYPEFTYGLDKKNLAKLAGYIRKYVFVALK